ncbi:MAG: Phosphate regulon transcriptional regulatory protein PhoB [Pseudomonadota bacterium]|jgi:two-component system phosphate regulon response regulator PhoB
MSEPFKVLVVEDEPSIAELIAINLKHAGFEPSVVFDAIGAQRELDAEVPDLVLLDWMLPGQSGESLLRRWRSQPPTASMPVIMLTARSQESDKVIGLEVGADDYITKPFSNRELIARIQAVMRRNKPVVPSHTLLVGALKLDESTYRVTFQHQSLKLGPTEFKLLSYFMRHPERVHTRQRLLDQVWGDDSVIDERTVDVHIKRLRHALDGAASMIETVRGAGYRLTNHVSV